MKFPEEPSSDYPREERAPQPGGDGGEEIRDKADELLEAARRRGRGLLDRQKQAAVDELHSVADVMRDAAQKFEDRQEGGVAGWVEKAADTVDRLSATLRDRKTEDLLRETEGLLRRRPGTFLGVTAVVGFAIGRFLRASGKRIAAPSSDPAQDKPAAEPEY